MFGGGRRGPSVRDDAHTNPIDDMFSHVFGGMNSHQHGVWTGRAA